MADYHLPVYEAQALAVITELRPAAASGDLDAAGAVRLATAYRMMAACAVLMRMDGVETNAWFGRSGQAFLATNSRSPYQGPAAGRALPFRDALAGGDLGVARAIAALLPTVLREDEEFADEFFFQRFLIAQFLTANAKEAAMALEALSTCREAAEDGRLLICEAFQRGNQESFAQGLMELIEAHRTRYVDLTQREAAPDIELCTLGAICIDGLAMVRLASAAGIAIADQYPLIPNFLIATAPTPLAANAWLSEPSVV